MDLRVVVREVEILCLNGEHQPSYLDGLVEYGRDFVVVVAIACSRHDRGETRMNWNSEGEGSTSE